MFLIYWSYDHYTNHLILEMHLFISPLGDILVFVVCSGQVILLNSMEVAMEMLLFLFSCSRQVTSEACH
jgi:hypothetical protein